MSENENERDDALENSSEEEEETSEETEEESEEEESEEETEQENWQEKYEKERQARLRAEKLIAQRKRKAKEEKSAKPDLSEEGDDDIKQKVQKLEQSEQKREFGYTHGLSPDEVDKVFQIDPTPSEKTLKDPFVKAGLQAIRKQKRLNDNTPSSSERTAPTAQKDFKELPNHEKNEKWQKFMRSKGVIK